MTSSRYPHITDELLSAYIDDTVTEDEKALIEAAIINEPTIAWRLETLRYTVNLLNSLPSVALPRSFALSEIQMFNGAVQPALVSQTNQRAAKPSQAPRPRVGIGGLGQSWRDFWQIGNLFLRNAAAASLAIFLVLSVGNFFVTSSTLPTSSRSPATASSGTAAPNALLPSVTKSTVAESTPALAPTTAPVQNQAVIQQTPTIQTASTTVHSAPEKESTPAVAGVKAGTSLQALRRNRDTVLPSGEVGANLGGSSVQSGSPDSALDATEYAPAAPITAASVAQPDQEAARKIESPTVEAASSAKVNAYAAPTTVVTNTITSTMAMTEPQGALTDVERGTANTVLATVTPTATNTPVANSQGTSSLNATMPTPVVKPRLAQRDSANKDSANKDSANKALGTASYLGVLQIAQLVFALITLIFAFLWWRSHRADRQMAER